MPLYANPAKRTGLKPVVSQFESEEGYHEERKMTRNEFYEKYGDVKVKFSHYYKFSFTYVGTLEDGGRLSCSFGGNSDDIYRTTVTNDEECLVRNLYPYTGVVSDANGNEIESFYDY